MSRVSNEDLAMFAQVNANQPRMLAHLEAEREAANKSALLGRDMVSIHRAQGEVAALDRVIALLKGAGAIIVKQREAALRK